MKISLFNILSHFFLISLFSIWLHSNLDAVVYHSVPHNFVSYPPHPAISYSHSLQHNFVSLYYFINMKVKVVYKVNYPLAVIVLFVCYLESWRTCQKCSLQFFFVGNWLKLGQGGWYCHWLDITIDDLSLVFLAPCHINMWSISHFIVLSPHYYVSSFFISLFSHWPCHIIMCPPSQFMAFVLLFCVSSSNPLGDHQAG